MSKRKRQRQTTVNSFNRALRPNVCVCGATMETWGVEAIDRRTGGVYETPLLSVCFSCGAKRDHDFNTEFEQVRQMSRQELTDFNAAADRTKPESESAHG